LIPPSRFRPRQRGVAPEVMAGAESGQALECIRETVERFRPSCF
jgi:hypothetical protein